MKVNHNFRKLKIWIDAFDLVVNIYEEVANYPKEEKYGIKSQLQRAVVSIAANIAEGSARGSNPDFIRFLYISKGSIAEIITLLSLATKLQLTTSNSVDPMIEKLIQIDKSIFNLINNLQEKNHKS